MARAEFAKQLDELSNMIAQTISHYKILEKVQVVARHEFLKKGE